MKNKTPMSTTKKIAIATAVGVGIAAPVAAYAILRRRKARNAVKKTLVAVKDQALKVAENHGGTAARAARLVRVGTAALKTAKAKGRSASRPVVSRSKAK